MQVGSAVEGEASAEHLEEEHPEEEADEGEEDWEDI